MIPRKLTALAASFFLSFPSACSTTNPPAPPEQPSAPAAAEPGPPDDVISRTLWDAIAASEPAPRPPASAADGAGERSIQVKGSGSQPRFDVAVSDIPAREFFLSLVEGTSKNVVVHPEVEGRISLALRNVTIEEVLDAVHDAYGYSYEKVPYGYSIQPRGLQTRIYQLNYLDVRRSGQSQTRVSSGQISDSSNGGGDSKNGGTGSQSRSGGGVTSGSSVETDTDADFWRSVARSIASLVGDADGRSVVTNPNTGLVIVRAMPEEHRSVASFLKRVEVNLHRQVILEAKVLEVRLTDGFQSGINWSYLLPLRGENSGVASQTGGGTLLADGVSEIAGNVGNLDPSVLVPIAGADASAFGGAFSTALDLGDFTAFIELLATQGEVRTLSSPRVSTVNNQKAVIKVGSDEFFVTDVSSTTVTGTTTTTTPDITLTPFFSGIALDVTPQISEEGEIVLHIHPSISDVVDQTKNIKVGGVDQSLPLALSTIRESDSIVRARSGQVIVIGGLMQDNNKDDHAGTPWLSRVPWLGFLFRQQGNFSSKTELVILLRVTTIGEGTWKNEIEQSTRRIDALEPWREPTLPGLDPDNN